jgi:hypothetical protein
MRLRINPSERDEIATLVKLGSNGLAIRSVPQGIAYRCCYPLLFFLKLIVVYQNRG